MTPSILRCLDCRDTSYFAPLRDGDRLVHEHLFVDGGYVSLGYRIEPAEGP